ncbi:MAG: DNA phosphorothioation-associated putative methyltransferase [Actinobacteria bacterium]|nr:DNA phosphorothioation-associated putative methyltransferase [Actinomycetota bacterium]
MNFTDYRDLVNALTVGKHLPDATYVHVSAISEIPYHLAEFTLMLSDQFDIDEGDWNVLKYYRKDFKISYLHYPDFDDYAYPKLETSRTLDIERNALRIASYSKSNNPPILHRKESFVSITYPLRPLFIEITEEGESIGLYINKKQIGFKQNWERLIKSKGYYLDDKGRLHPLSEKTSQSKVDHTVEIERHRTAIDRNKLSSPMQALARHNYLNSDYSILDYGCGKGDDVRELESHGLDVTGWDPVHRPNEEYDNKDIVNLGFVLNVIEDRKERTETLLRAWKHTNKILSVAVMVAGEAVISQFTPYKDGVITSRNTFQKYYSQGEIKYYIESTLDESAIAVGQGLFLIFRDKLEEQIFLSERQHIKRDWRHKTQRQLTLKPKTINKDVVDKNIELFNDYWETTLELGRMPSNSEFEFSDQIRKLCGSHIKAHQTLLEYYGSNLYEEARNKRREDLTVYLALSMFDKRRPQSKMPESLRRDIKIFFDSHQQAIEQAKEILFSVGNPAIIHNACNEAYMNLSCGLMEEGHSYTFHSKCIGDLPATLRIYIGCATQLYGDIEKFQLIKAHIRSGKVSLLRFDKWDNEKPQLVERVKIKLRDLDIDFYEYGAQFSSPYLQNKKIYTECSTGAASRL